jgi:hypothetical protein
MPTIHFRETRVSAYKKTDPTPRCPRDNNADFAEPLAPRLAALAANQLFRRVIQPALQRPEYHLAGMHHRSGVVHDRAM